MPKFYYKGYEVKLDQQVIRNYNKNGLVTVRLEQGLHEISVTYKKTVIQKFSAIFSVLLAGSLIFYNIIKSRRKNK